MKKIILILCVALYLLSAWPLINREMTTNANPSARTWSVDDDGPADFNSIQAAINNASSGDTIFVHVGTYYEHLFINKTIALVGEDNSFTIIDGNETNDVVHVKADNVTVENFAVMNSGKNQYTGILVDNSIGVIIINNNVTYNYEGVRLVFSDRNVVCDNIFTYNYDGVYVYSSNNNVFSNNTIGSNTNYGVYVYYSNNNAFSDNLILANSNGGVNIFSSNSNAFSDNTISSNNYDGVYVYSSSNNIFSSNTIISNSHYGISLVQLSRNNTIYHNNFGNEAQAKSESTNFWDHDNEGNYWSDYNKQDLNIDGIGDTPYVIGTANRDNYPLMGMFSEFNITKEGETYGVTAISNSTISPFKFQIGTETGNKIIYFTSAGKDNTEGFCRVKIPTELMNYPYIVVVGGEEITPTVLNVSSETYAYLYFAYPNRNQTVTIISSKTLQLYLELLDTCLKLQLDLQGLNETYHALFGNNSILLYNYTQLKSSFDELNNSYQQYLLDYSEQTQNFRNLTYIFVALTAILIIITVYLSKHSHANLPTKIKMVEER